MVSVLIIDDDVALLSRLGAQLELAGFKVEQSSDLAHGERRCAEWQPDLVVLEVRTSDERGWEALPRLAATAPVIVLSGSAREEDVVRAFSAGAADFVAKPYRSAELHARLRARVGRPLAYEVASTPTKPAKTAAPTGTVTGDDAPRVTAIPPNDDAVFMSEAEEMALLRASTTARPLQTNPSQEFDATTGLGVQLRTERMRRHLTLVQIENELKIRLSYLQAMEDEKFTLLPRGPAALQMVRSYADHLGLDGAAAAAHFKTQGLGDAVAPLPSLGGTALRRPPPRWVIMLTAIILALVLGLGAILAFDPGFFERLPAFFAGLWQQIMALLPG